MNADQTTTQAAEDLKLLRWLKDQISNDKLNVTLKHDNGKEYYDRKDGKGKPDYHECRCSEKCGGKWSIITEIPKNLKGGWLPCQSLVAQQEAMYKNRLARLNKFKPKLEQLGINMEQRISDVKSEMKEILGTMKQRRYNEKIFSSFFPKNLVQETEEKMIE